eukprot:358162-Chlamydomonas_euryale.AAC.7
MHAITRTLWRRAYVSVSSSSLHLRACHVDIKIAAAQHTSRIRHPVFRQTITAKDLCGVEILSVGPCGSSNRCPFSRPLRELEDLVHNLQAGGHLPQEQADVGDISRNVHRARVVVTLLHRRHQRSSKRPQSHDARAGKQVRAGEQLPGAHVRVHTALDGNADARGQQDGAHDLMLVLELAGQQRLALRLLGLDLARDG